MSDYTFCYQAGDMNPFDHDGMYIFKETDGENYFVIEVQNISGNCGSREEPNENAVWLNEFYVDVDDALGNIEEIKSSYGMKDDFFYNEDGSINVMAVVEGSVQLRLVDHDSSERYSTFSEAAQIIMDVEPDNEDLRMELDDYLSSNEKGQWIDWYLEDVVDGYIMALLDTFNENNRANLEGEALEYYVEQDEQDIPTPCQDRIINDCLEFVSEFSYDDLCYMSAEMSHRDIGEYIFLARNYFRVPEVRSQHNDNLGMMMFIKAQSLGRFTDIDTLNPVKE